MVELKFEPFRQKILKHDVELFEGDGRSALAFISKRVGFHPFRPRDNLVVLIR
jgi:hypothetical protein